MKKKIRRFWRQATADKKKFGLLVTVAAVGLLLWGRLILLEKVPRMATATPTPQAEKATDALEPSGQPLNLSPLPEVRTQLSDELALNLFAFRHDRYKLRPQEDSGQSGVQPGNDADDEQQRRRLLAEKARDLRLQSVTQGSVPLVVINGRVLRVGGSIEGFEIVSIYDRSAQVTRDGLTFTLTMLSD